MTIEHHADAILRAAGDRLADFHAMPQRRQAILTATEAAYEAGRKAGWTAFGELMMEQFGPDGRARAAAIMAEASAAPKIQHSEGE